MGRFATVTETPGLGATREQRSMLYTRYHLARQYAHGKTVLEVACGAGLGLGYLGEVAQRVVGVDIEPENLRIARDTYCRHRNIEVMAADAEQLPLPSATFDTVLLYEALYYLPRPDRFLAEVQRVLAPGGTLLVCTVNCAWHGFNRSPFSEKYFAGAELTKLLDAAGFETTLMGGFLDHSFNARRKLIAAVRRWAVRARLIPKTMRGKERLKQLFYGTLARLEPCVHDGMAPLETLRELTPSDQAQPYKVLYAIARPSASTVRAA